MKIRMKSDHAVVREVNETGMTCYEWAKLYTDGTKVSFHAHFWEPVPEEKWEPCPIQVGESMGTGRIHTAIVRGTVDDIVVNPAGDVRVTRTGPGTLLFERRVS